MWQEWPRRSTTHRTPSTQAQSDSQGPEYSAQARRSATGTTVCVSSWKLTNPKVFRPKEHIAALDVTWGWMVRAELLHKDRNEGQFALLDNRPRPLEIHAPGTVAALSADDRASGSSPRHNSGGIQGKSAGSNALACRRSCGARGSGSSFRLHSRRGCGSIRSRLAFSSFFCCRCRSSTRATITARWMKSTQLQSGGEAMPRGALGVILLVALVVPHVVNVALAVAAPFAAAAFALVGRAHSRAPFANS